MIHFLVLFARNTFTKIALLNIQIWPIVYCIISSFAFKGLWKNQLSKMILESMKSTILADICLCIDTPTSFIYCSRNTLLPLSIINNYFIISTRHRVLSSLYRPYEVYSSDNQCFHSSEIWKICRLFMWVIALTCQRCSL